MRGLERLDSNSLDSNYQNIGVVPRVNYQSDSAFVTNRQGK